MTRTWSNVLGMIVALAGGASLRRNFGEAGGAVGLVLGLMAPLVCVAAALAVAFVTVRGTVRK